MKPMLAMSKRGDPASCAIALTKDKDGVILLDKRKKPKKLLAELKKTAAGIGLELETTTLRFGRAVVDPDTDAKLLSLTVNKEAPGAMRPRLLEQIKKAGFSKLEIVVDTNLEAEPEEEQPAAPPPGAVAPPPDSAAAPPTPSAPTAPDAGTVPADAPQAPSQTAAPEVSTAEMGSSPDAAVLTKELTELTRQVLAVIERNPAQKEKLAELAKAAQASLKRGDLMQVSSDIAALRDALADAGAGGSDAAPAAPNGADPAMIQKLHKTRAVWDATIAKVTRDLDQLVKAVTAASVGHQLGAGFEREFQTVVKPLLTTVDTSLSDLLTQAAKASTAEEHRRMLDQARETVGGLTKFVQSHPVVGHLDDNPFVPMAVGKTLNASLSAVSSTLR